MVFGPAAGIDSGSFVAPLSATQGVLRITLAATDNRQRQATATVTLFPGPSWRAFYPFSNDGADASNGFHGTLEGGATVQPDPLLGGVLSLSGNGQYLSLPVDVASVLTIAALVKWRGGAPLQRLFDFHRDGRASFYLTPRSPPGGILCSITPDQFSYVHTIESDTPFPVNEWTHVAVTLDGREGILYLNGQPVGVNHSVNLLPSDLAAVNCWLGRSQSPAHPYFDGEIDSVVLSSGTLWPERTLVQPPLLATAGAGGFRLRWPVWASALKPWSSTNIADWMGWSLISVVPEVSNGFLNLSQPLAGRSRFYRLQWP